MHVADNQLLLFPPARPLAERLGADFFRAVPERPGVYLMSAARDGVLYVGKAKNLRRRLGNYRSATSDRLPRKLTRLLLRVERIDWDECADEAAALARERELIRTLQPRFNTMGVRPPKEWFIGWRQRDGILTLALDESLDGWPVVRGPFVFARPAFAVLLRSLWLELHPGASVAEAPSPLLEWSGPTRWSVPQSDAALGWLKEAESFLSGSESRLLPPDVCPPLNLNPTLALTPREELQTQIRITSRIKIKKERSTRFDNPGDAECMTSEEESPQPLTFDEQWHGMDLECLAEFHQRLVSQRPSAE